MGRVPKKPRGVKGSKKAKQPSPPRFTIKRDSLNRRYAIDKRTGKRVSVVKAEKEREKRKKAKQPKPATFRGIKPPKAKQKAPKAPKAKKDTRKPAKLPKPPVTRKPRAKKGEKPKSIPPVPIALAPIIPGLEPYFPPMPHVPPGMRMVILGGIAERAERFPKVKEASEAAWEQLQLDSYTRRIGRRQGQKPIGAEPPKDFRDRKAMGDFIRYEVYTRALEIADIDNLVEELLDEDYHDFSARELYTLYFSPEVA